ncbi:UpxY family transcription antiterminator [Paludibacter propionicigenes]|uniref:UpxY family transcription antiterminator n=1 Tax=Paludibacter propionicigenes TaxID=185300 RepID=UPI0011D15D2E|nr:UpxY family transcription antiterminator [Paludibacter propionicigenes]
MKEERAIQSEKLSWYAVYTAPRAEKKVSERFSDVGIEHYLALQKVKRRWSDRIKEVLIPVVNGYIFVHIQDKDFEKVTKIYGAIAFVREGGRPVAIPDCQIENLRLMVEGADEPIEFSVEDFARGESVTITKGPLTGMMGELVEVKGKHKVLIRLERFGSAITTVPVSFIEKVL